MKTIITQCDTVRVWNKYYYAEDIQTFTNSIARTNDIASTVKDLIQKNILLLITN